MLNMKFDNYNIKNQTSKTMSALAVTLDAIAIPDFIAGFMFGYTGENHLVEIEQCYSGGDNLLMDV